MNNHKILLATKNRKSYMKKKNKLNANIYTNIHTKKNEHILIKKLWIDNILFLSVKYTMAHNYRFRTYYSINRQLDERYQRLIKLDRIPCK
jgi:N12 class adenine-specific DNA methylase